MSGIVCSSYKTSNILGIFAFKKIYFASIFYTSLARAVNNGGGVSLVGKDEFFQIFVFHYKIHRLRR